MKLEVRFGTPYRTLSRTRGEVQTVRIGVLSLFLKSHTIGTGRRNTLQDLPIMKWRKCAKTCCRILGFGNFFQTSFSTLKILDRLANACMGRRSDNNEALIRFVATRSQPKCAVAKNCDPSSLRCVWT